jgi:regulator of protease activity HflC (stomatin/prohibitin superfamily)
MYDTQALQDWIKGRANTYVLGLLFASLLVIYLVIPPSNLVTFLCVTILAMSLIVAVTGQWNELMVLGIFAAFVSLVAAYLYGSTLRFGRTSGILLLLLWGILLFLLLRRVSGGLRPVPLSDEAPAILISRGSDRRPYVAPPPLVIPFLQPIVAIIPRKELIDEVEVTNINTKKNHNITQVRVHVRYRIVDPVEAFTHTSQSTLIDAAHGKDLDEARLDVTFWEDLFEEHLLKIDVIKAVREVAFRFPMDAEPPIAGAADLYSLREEFGRRVLERLNDREPLPEWDAVLFPAWGAIATSIEIDEFEVDETRFRSSVTEARRRASEAAEAAHLAGMEADRLRLVLDSEVNAEAQRVRAIIDALRDSGVEITPDVVIRAIRAASDWVMESEYSLQPTMAPNSQPAPKPPADKK